MTARRRSKLAMAATAEAPDGAPTLSTRSGTGSHALERADFALVVKLVIKSPLYVGVHAGRWGMPPFA